MNSTSFESTKTLIVGGAGFVGSNLAHSLLNHNIHELIIIDNLLSSERSNIPNDQRVTFIEGSITDKAILHRIPNDLDYVFHLACYHGNQSSIANPIADHDNNSLTSLLLFDKLKDQNLLKKVVYAAAGCAVAEKTEDTPTATTEDAPVSLFHDSPYSISKLIGELYGNYYFQQYEFPIVKARFQNVYGPREILGAGQWRGTPHTVWRNVIPTFIWKALHHETLELDNAGLNSRDFIYVDDLVEGLIACAILGNPGEVYNLATGQATTILALAEKINSITRNTEPLEVKPKRTWDRSGKRFGSIEKAKEKLHFESKVSIDEGLGRTVDWTQTSNELIKSCIAKHRTYVKQDR